MTTKELTKNVRLNGQAAAGERSRDEQVASTLQRGRVSNLVTIQQKDRNGEALDNGQIEVHCDPYTLLAVATAAIEAERKGQTHRVTIRVPNPGFTRAWRAGRNGSQISSASYSIWAPNSLNRQVANAVDAKNQDGAF